MKNNKMLLVLALAMFVLALAPTSADAKVIGGGGQYLLVSEGYNFPDPAPTVVTQSTQKAVTPTVTTQGATSADGTNADGSVLGASDKNTSNLGASVASSGWSFMPDTLLEWAFLFIIILLGVKLWRSATITEKEKHAPLKHA